MTLDGSAWVDRTMTEVWDRVASVVPETWMPRIATGSTRSKKYKRVEEYGCGHYGCVMPTSEPGLVCKLTSDVSEARFVVRALTLGGTYGIVEYSNIYALRGVERSSGWGHKRPMFVLWRSEAYNVGLLQGYPHMFASAIPEALNSFIRDDYDRRTLREGLALLDNFQQEAAVARRYIKPRLQAAENREAFLKDVWITYELADYSKVEVERNYRRAEVYGAPKWVTGLRRVGIAIENCRWIASEMTGTPLLNRVGEALLHYLDEGLLLADVHRGNIGVSDDNELIITDPGHVVEIHPRWAGPVEITEI
jgi:hypothetical protein